MDDDPHRRWDLTEYVSNGHRYYRARRGRYTVVTDSAAKRDRAMADREEEEALWPRTPR